MAILASFEGERGGNLSVENCVRTSKLSPRNPWRLEVSFVAWVTKAVSSETVKSFQRAITGSRGPSLNDAAFDFSLVVKRAVERGDTFRYDLFHYH